MKINKRTLLFFFILIAVTTIVKVLCAPNLNLSGFSATIAVALFAGFSIKDARLAILLPLLSLFISDVLIQLLYTFGGFKFPGFYDNQWINYVLIAAITFLGMAFRKGGAAGIIASAVVAPGIFFVVSNYIVWATQSAMLGYSNDFGGLMACYRAGLPFYRNSILSTIIFLPVFIAAYHWLLSGKFTLQTAK
ncbi:hypothetical protein I5907_02685 [Panacibacter sp. DH6]|uniref:Uncharacterized protein n=1 Tax=Panacibacter microcysteis TaxID=2793269 RepID=A0A931GX69_9BACT|nr:DUF6580 family putative transport protein [Panacibacter microcysteis]MBG9375119.1 hypothetical protein [Panacibacter microcysteis]